MARRKKSKNSPGAGIFLAGASALALAVGVYFIFFKPKASSEGREALEFRIEHYFEDSARLIGGRYALTARTVARQKWTEENGSLWLVAIKDKQGAEREIGLLLPQEFAAQNVQIGEDWDFVVEVRRAGAIIVKSMKKA